MVVAMIDFYSSVQLPDKATITNVTFYWYDTDAILDKTFALGYSPPNGTTAISMSGGYSSGSSGYGSTTDTSIFFSTIDNSNYAYYLYVGIPATFPYNNLRFLMHKLDSHVQRK